MLFHLMVVALAVVLAFVSKMELSDATAAAKTTTTMMGSIKGSAKQRSLQDLTPEEKAQAMLDQMNITEKLVMMSGTFYYYLYVYYILIVGHFILLLSILLLFVATLFIHTCM